MCLVLHTDTHNHKKDFLLEYSIDKKLLSYPFLHGLLARLELLNSSPGSVSKQISYLLLTSAAAMCVFYVCFQAAVCC